MCIMSGHQAFLTKTVALQLSSSLACSNLLIQTGAKYTTVVLVDLVYKGMRWNGIPSMRLKK